jgi:hypothetical protein
MRALWAMSVCALAGCASGPTPVQVRQMGQRGDTAALFEAWETADKEPVRVAVLEAFAQNPSDAAGQRLVVKQAREASARPVQLAALQALAAYQGDDVVGALVPALGHPWPEAREVARANLAAQGRAPTRRSWPRRGRTTTPGCARGR